MMKIADSLRLCALFVHSTHEKCGTPQALCTPIMKIADSLRLCAFFVHSNHGNWVVQQAAAGGLLQIVETFINCHQKECKLLRPS